MLASKFLLLLGRIPFDIHHAESEVVGGPFVEYSGAHWAVFYLAEYMNTFTVAVLTTILFLGGWVWPEMHLKEDCTIFYQYYCLCLKLFQ